jgi:hypothetical protein
MKIILYLLIFLPAVYIYGRGSTIHIIGDSHGFFCFNNTQSGITADEKSVFHYSKNGNSISVPFYIHWLGSRTMHRVGRDGLVGLNIKNLGVHEGDVVVFLFGEVDVRCHIGRQRDEKVREQSEVINTLANAYIETLASNKKLYTNIVCFVCSITPPCDRGYNSSYPFYGSLSERVSITQELNNSLKECSRKHGIHFLDVYSIYAQDDGSLGLAVSDGIIHINPKYNYHIKEKLIEALIDKKIL